MSHPSPLRLDPVGRAGARWRRAGGIADAKSASATVGKCCRWLVAVGDAIVVIVDSQRFANSVPRAPGQWPRDRLSVRWCPATVAFFPEAAVATAGQWVASRSRFDAPGCFPPGVGQAQLRSLATELRDSSLLE